MPESFQSRLKRWGFNFFPAYRGTGGRLTYLADDFHEIHVKLPLNRRTRNYVGTIFGGSMYGAVDPMYMVMLIKILGRDFVVWDKAAEIRFKRPGKETLYAKFKIEADEIEAIKDELIMSKSIERVYRVNLVDRAGKVHAEVLKTLYIARKKAPEALAVKAQESVAAAAS
jgi:acyl-coenzyme A thioesterase PaaI-like protein